MSRPKATIDPDTVATVIALVSKHTGISSRAILSRKRGKQPVAYARQIAMTLLFQDDPRTEAVARAFRRTGHSVTHAARAISDLSDVYTETRILMNYLQAKLRFPVADEVTSL